MASKNTGTTMILSLPFNYPRPADASEELLSICEHRMGNHCIVPKVVGPLQITPDPKFENPHQIPTKAYWILLQPNSILTKHFQKSASMIRHTKPFVILLALPRLDCLTGDLPGLLRSLGPWQGGLFDPYASGYRQGLGLTVALGICGNRVGAAGLGFVHKTLLSMEQKDLQEARSRKATQQFQIWVQCEGFRIS